MYDISALSYWARLANIFLSHLVFCFSKLQIRNGITIIKNAEAIWTLLVSFLTVQFYDSKESKKISIFYMRHRGKQNKGTHKSQLIVIEQQQHSIAWKHCTYLLTYIVLTCTYIILSENHKQFSTSLYWTQIFSAWVQQLPSTFFSRNMFTSLNTFT